MPDAESVFNKVQSSERMEIENVFGIVTCRTPVTKNLQFKGKEWREDVAAVVTACMILHNLCIHARDPPLDYVPPPRKPPREEAKDRDSDKALAHDNKRAALTQYLFERFEWRDNDVHLRR